MKEIDKTQEIYKETIADISNPFFVKVYNLHINNPNDADFGNKLRKTILEIEQFQKERAMRLSDQQLKSILKNESGT